MMSMSTGFFFFFFFLNLVEKFAVYACAPPDGGTIGETLLTDRHANHEVSLG